MTASRTIALTLGSLLIGSAALPAHASGKPKVPPVSVERTDDGEPVLVHEGEASFYGGKFHGRTTANGETMNQNKPTAASPALPLGSKATVTNQDNGKSVDVIVNDRGPYVDGRVIDLSRNAARTLDMIEDGTAPVRVEAKPSEQPTDTAKEKVEAKAEQTEKTEAKAAARTTQAGGRGSDTVSQPGSGK